ncbi:MULTISPECIES: phosphorylcholine transferase LicD [unclassified Vibrio]|uniref:LicD family protein n=1 Tax=unclassified Vibrio TaxID=2614977 RepID=UPI00354C85B4
MKSDLVELQDNILYIAKYFDQLCRENDIQYFLLGGTALGAARHGGFIPWDDDFDVCMKHKDYVRFCEIAKNKLDTEVFYFQEGNTKEWPLYFSKIRMNNTTYIEEDVRGREMHHGIYIDIMCLNNTFSNKFLRYTQYLSAKLLSASALHRRGFITDSKMKKIVMKFVGPLVVSPVRKVLLGYVQILNRKQDDSYLLSHFFGRAKFNNTSIKSKWAKFGRRVKFSSAEFSIMTDNEKYLSLRFGNSYMELPSESVKAQYPSHCSEYKVAEQFKK